MNVVYSPMSQATIRTIRADGADWVRPLIDNGIGIKGVGCRKGNMKTILTLCVMLLASASGASTNNLGTISAQQETKVQSSAIDDLIKSIHADILQLQTNHAWLSGYTNSCFWGNAIFFMPKLTESDGLQAQQPDQLCIVYGPIGQKKGFKYDNQVEDVPSCQFPELKLKVYAHILIRGNENAKCAEAVRECIIKHCEELHKQMKTSHLDRQPHR